MEAESRWQRENMINLINMVGIDPVRRFRG